MEHSHNTKFAGYCTNGIIESISGNTSEIYTVEYNQYQVSKPRISPSSNVKIWSYNQNVKENQLSLSIDTCRTGITVKTLWKMDSDEEEYGIQYHPWRNFVAGYLSTNTIMIVKPEKCRGIQTRLKLHVYFCIVNQRGEEIKLAEIALQPVGMRTILKYNCFKPTGPVEFTSINHTNRNLDSSPTAPIPPSSSSSNLSTSNTSSSSSSSWSHPSSSLSFDSLPTPHSSNTIIIDDDDDEPTPHSSNTIIIDDDDDEDVMDTHAWVNCGVESQIPNHQPSTDHISHPPPSQDLMGLDAWDPSMMPPDLTEAYLQEQESTIFYPQTNQTERSSMSDTSCAYDYDPIYDDNKIKKADTNVTLEYLKNWMDDNGIDINNTQNPPAVADNLESNLLPGSPCNNYLNIDAFGMLSCSWMDDYNCSNNNGISNSRSEGVQMQNGGDELLPYCDAEETSSEVLDRGLEKYTMRDTLGEGWCCKRQ